MNLQMEFEVKKATRQWIVSIMERYNIPASVMVNALNETILELKNIVIEEIYQELYSTQTQEEEITDVLIPDNQD